MARVVRPVVVAKGKPRVVLDKEDLAEIRAGKGRPSAAEEAREARAAKMSLGAAMAKKPRGK
jgi:hypothetical protein